MNSQAPWVRSGNNHPFRTRRSTAASVARCDPATATTSAMRSAVTTDGCRNSSSARMGATLAVAMHIIQGPLISMRIVANDEVSDHDLETMLDMTVKALGATHGQTDARTLMAAPLAQRSSVKTRWGLHTIDRPLASPMR